MARRPSGPGGAGTGGSFLSLRTPDEAREILARFGPIGRAGEVPVADAAGRVLVNTVISPEDHPTFRRAAMDGFAVRAADTFGAGEGLPAYLTLAGTVEMGRIAQRALEPGEAFEISTGACLPEGADAVVMVEYTERAGHSVEVTRPAGVGEHVILPGDDVKRGSSLIPAGRRLRAADLALAAALGITTVAVADRPRVFVLSTGDELVPAAEVPGPAQVRDVNSISLSAQVRRSGGDPIFGGIVPDDPDAIRDAVARALAADADVVLLSGGSSAGARDHTVTVLESFGPPGVLVHGIAVAPGKPTIVAARGDVPLIGMPGYPVASLVIFDLFLAPMIERMGGVREPPPPFGPAVQAKLTRQIASKPGREDYVRVSLGRGTDGLREATPLRGGTGALSSLATADGFVRVSLHQEGISAGAEVEVMTWR